MLEVRKLAGLSMTGHESGIGNQKPPELGAAPANSSPRWHAAAYAMDAPRL